MTLDHYVLAFLRTFSSGFFRLMIGLTKGDCILTFFVAIFMLNDFCLKEDVVAISAFAGNNVTMTYAEIGASFQQ